MYTLSAVYGRRGVAIHTISGIDIALWDILGKTTGMPVHRLLGGGYHQKVKAYASMLMPDSREAIKAQVQQCVDQGFKAVKLGWGALGSDLDRDLELISAVRVAFGDDIDLMIDIGFGMGVNRAIEFARRLEPLNVFFLEEPLSPDNLTGYARLSSQSRIPIATGEKETTYFGFRELILRGKLDIIQPDVARAGGITECKKIVDLAEKEGVVCIPHCWSSDILLSATLQLVACIPNIPYIEFCTLETPLRTEVAHERIQVVDGQVEIPGAPGIGIELNRETLERYHYQPAE
jgi:L-alanine-DL-glutamate epimerase-like enolase superfamily enzyme